MHLHFIVNPAAGGNTCLPKFAPIEQALAEEDVDFSVVYSEYAGHATQLARQALMAGHDCVVAVGGDGTVREVAQELLHSGIPLGILPFGTGNDLIRVLGIPSDPRKAVRLLLEGEAQTIDAALANNQLYLNVAGFGFDVDVLEQTRHYKTRFRGSFAYFLGVVHAMFGMRSYQVTITMPEETISREVLLVAVGNGTHIGGGMMVTPKADPTDGLLDLCVVDKMPWYKIFYFLYKFIKGEHLQMSPVQYRQVSELQVVCKPGSKIQLDGEIIEDTPAGFQVVPGALLVLGAHCTHQTAPISRPA